MIPYYERTVPVLSKSFVVSHITNSLTTKIGSEAKIVYLFIQELTGPVLAGYGIPDGDQHDELYGKRTVLLKDLNSVGG